jgi:hypothetical protein
MLGPQFEVLRAVALRLGRYQPAEVHSQQRRIGPQIGIDYVAARVVTAEVVPDCAPEFFCAASRW